MHVANYMGMDAIVCNLCGGICISTAGDPSKWPMYLPYYNGNGQTRAYHMGCVVDAVHEAEIHPRPRKPESAPVCTGDCSADGFYYDEECPVHGHQPWFGTHIREAIAVVKHWWNSRKK